MTARACAGALVLQFVVTTLCAATSIRGAGGLLISVETNGSYEVALPSVDWRLGGDIGQPLSNVNIQDGSDAAGAYTEITFDYVAGGARHGAIRAYANRQAVLFSVKYVDAAANTAPFPVLTRYPSGLNHLSFSGIFAAPSFAQLSNESPWVFFDSNANAFILSPASQFMISGSELGPNGTITAGISPRIGSLPAGLTHSTLLVIEAGINRAYETWGRTLLDLGGTKRVANDSDPVLNFLGYWTDNGATYYYRPEPSMSYEQTLTTVKSEFDQLGIRLGYMQLDSWFYPKGPNRDWQDKAHGIYEYVAAPALFANTLGTFQKTLGIPLVTHARWIDSSSPYRQRYKMSGNVVTEMGYWDTVASYLADSGVISYEQDWLGAGAQTDFNFSDADTFLGNMASATGRRGITMQYCMATPRHFLQTTRYKNATNIRTSGDRFDRHQWWWFLYTSRLASALGISPFADVFMSGETNNLLLSVLSAGPVGVGDRIGVIDAKNLARAVRGDGVIVKPDAPIVPLDRAYIDEAKSVNTPVIASTYTDFGGVKAKYVFAYSRAANTVATFTLADLGIEDRAYVYDYFAGRGRVYGPADVLTEQLGDGAGYYIVVPVGESGIALLGDKEQFVTLSKKRISQVTDDGTVNATVVFAAGETSRTLFGYAIHKPRIVAHTGTVSGLTYDAAKRVFTVRVMPGLDNSASVRIWAPADRRRDPPRPSPRASLFDGSGEDGPNDRQ